LTSIGTEKSRKVCEAVAETSSGICLFGFSRGKDSIAAWLYLRNFFHRIIPFHCTSVPHLGFIDRSLAYYEELFQTKIYRFLSGECSAALGRLVWQPPGCEEEIDRMELWEYSNRTICEFLEQELDLPGVWCAWGMSMYDSIQRRKFVGMYGGVNPRTRSFYPCFDWHKDQILALVESSGVKLAPDYRMHNRTLAGVPHYSHLDKMEELYPEDFKRLLLMWPMIRAEQARQKFRRTAFEGRNPSQSEPMPH